MLLVSWSVNVVDEELIVPVAFVRCRPTAAYGVIGPKPLLMKSSRPYVFSLYTSTPLIVAYEPRAASSGVSTEPRTIGMSIAPPYVFTSLFRTFAYVPETVAKPRPLIATRRGTAAQPPPVRKSLFAGTAWRHN